MTKKSNHPLLRHLRNNGGDGYIWFLIMTILMLLLFGALFGLIQTTVSTKDIRQEVDDAAAEIFADVRENPYDYLTLGSMSDTYTTVTNFDAANMFSAKLGGTITPSVSEETYVITVNDISGRERYTIKDTHVVYVDRLVSKEGEQNVFGGDINDNGVLDSGDIALMRDYIAGDAPRKPESGDPVLLDDVDINNDGIADAYDIKVVESLISYYAEVVREGPDDGTGSAAMLIISFKLTVQMRYGVMNYGEMTGIYAYPMLISIKSAKS